MLGITEKHRPAAARKWAKRIGITATVVVGLWGATHWLLRYGVGRHTAPEHEVILKRMSGGAMRYYSQNCEFPPPIRSHTAEATVGGEKREPDRTKDEQQQALSNHYQVAFWNPDPLYFVYSSQSFLHGQAMRIEARADFEPGGEHTVAWVIVAKTGECKAERVQESLKLSYE